VARPSRARTRALARVLVRPMPPGVGRYRIAVRAESRQHSSLTCSLAAADCDVEIAVFDDEQEVHAAQFQLTPNRPWQQVEFVPHCAQAKRAKVELRPAADVNGFRAVPLPGSFPTIPKPRETTAPNDPTAATERFFKMIAAHGVVSEEEAVRLFGSPRAFRRFSLDFEAHVARLPFRVRIEVAEDGKRYVREGDR